MKLSLKWLNNYVNVSDFFNQPEVLAEKLTQVGIEVESVENLAKNFENVVVGHIKKYERHPQADRLTLCQVDIGNSELQQIVCGATNHKEGDKVVAALPGAVLPGDFAIKISSIRQVESRGMLCSEKELGLSESAEGIIILPEDAPVGKSFAEYKGFDDIVLELSVTPNRADCLSHHGLAREIGAVLGRVYETPAPNFEALGESTKNQIQLNLNQPDLCLRYSGRCIFNVEIGPSPQWLKASLEAVGINSINNVVDVTNYVMLELGQPLHAFDMKQIRGQQIEIRKSKKGEPFKTFDGTEISLSDEELVIADGDGVVALAGVIGGINSGVTSNTKNLFIESAYFLKETVRKTGRKFGIETDSSYRFSRGVDPESVVLALNRACELIQKVAGGHISKDFHDLYPNHLERRPIEIHTSYVTQRLGYNVEDSEFESIIKSLGGQLKKDTEGNWQVLPPPYRVDLEANVDLVEEVARIKGYDQIPEFFPRLLNPPTEHSRDFLNHNNLSEIFIGEGFLQAINYGFGSKNLRSELLADFEKYSHFGLNIPSQGVVLLNPLNEETNEMRVSLLTGLYKNLVNNFRYGNEFGRLFEIGGVVEKSNDEYQEFQRLGCVIWGQPLSLWTTGAKQVPVVFELKSSIENLFAKLSITSYQWKQLDSQLVPKLFHPGQTTGVFVEGKMLGILGSLHPKIAQDQKIRTQAAFCEINLDMLLKGQPRGFKAKRFSRMQAVERDLSFDLPKQVSSSELINKIKKLGPKQIESLKVFDIYSDERKQDTRSITVKIVFRHESETLEETQISNWMDTITKGLQTTKWN